MIVGTGRDHRQLSRVVWAFCGLAVLQGGLPGQVVVHRGVANAAIQGRIEGQNIVYRVTNEGQEPITAWAVELQESFAGDVAGAQERLSDSWMEHISINEPKRTPGIVRDSGIIYPGQSFEGEFNLSRDVANQLPDLLELSITALIFDDSSYSGSEVIAETIFAQRRAASREKSRWNVQLRSARSVAALRPFE